jgi:hypothetical protein
MIRNTNPKYQEVVQRLEKLRQDAKELAIHIATSHGRIGASLLTPRDGSETIEALPDGTILFSPNEEEDTAPIAEPDLNLQRLGAMLDNSATNLGLWRS